MISRTKTSPPTLLRKCALENLKKEWKKKKISVRLIVCLNDMMNVAIVHKSREMVCVFTKKERKEIRTRLVNIHYIYLPIWDL